MRRLPLVATPKMQLRSSLWMVCRTVIVFSASLTSSQKKPLFNSSLMLLMVLPLRPLPMLVQNPTTKTTAPLTEGFVGGSSYSPSLFLPPLRCRWCVNSTWTSGHSALENTSEVLMGNISLRYCLGASPISVLPTSSLSCGGSRVWFFLPSDLLLRSKVLLNQHFHMISVTMATENSSPFQNFYRQM